MDYFNAFFGRAYNFVDSLVSALDCNVSYSLASVNGGVYRGNESKLEFSLFMGRKQRGDGKGSSHRHNHSESLTV